MKKVEPNVQLGPEELAVIAVAREAPGPSEVERARVRRGLDAKIAAGVLAPALVTSTALATVLKAGAGIAVAAALGTGVVAVARSHRPHLPAPPAAVPRGRTTATPAPALAPSAPPAIEPVTASETPAVIPHARVPPRRQEGGHEGPVGRAVAAAPADLAGELALLTQINSATKQGDLARAETLLQSYDQRYRAGQLAQERAAAGILLDCAAGRTQAARAGAARFLEAWPHSPLVARIQDVCAGGGKAP